MDPETVMAKPLIKDRMVMNNFKPYTIKITKPMLKTFRNPHCPYKIYLEEEKKKTLKRMQGTRTSHL